MSRKVLTFFHKTRSVLFPIYFFRNLQLLFVSFCVLLFRLFLSSCRFMRDSKQKKQFNKCIIRCIFNYEKPHKPEIRNFLYADAGKKLTQFNKFNLTFYYEWYIEETELLKVSKYYQWSGMSICLIFLNLYKLDRSIFSIIWFYTISSAMP